MKKNLVLLLAVLFLTPWIYAQTYTVGGVTFPGKLKINDVVTEYNGAGIRTKYFMSLYVSALYIPQKSTNAQAIIDQNKEAAIRLKIVSSLVTKERFIETVRDGFATSTEGSASKEEIDQLMSLFTGEFKKGDDIILAYKPDKGVQVYMNGHFLGGVEGLAFKKALWGIWLGETPADSDLKNEMLGID